MPPRPSTSSPTGTTTLAASPATGPAATQALEGEAPRRLHGLLQVINASAVDRRGTSLITVHVVGRVARRRRNLHPETSAFRVVK
jgi:hypothetical protein